MTDYQVFGRILRSEVSFPEIESTSPGSAEPALTLALGAPERHPEAPSSPPLGETTVGQGATVRLYREEYGFLLQFSDTGTFRITRDSIQWWPGPEGVSEALRVDVKGRVVPLALHLSGILCLHAGSVSIQGSAIALTGPKRVGKSTLTAALVAAGARFLTDDVLGVISGVTPTAVPGFPAFRLWRDSAARVSLSSDYREAGLGGKLNVRASDLGGAADSAPLPLTAVYFLRAADPAEVQAAVRRPLPERMAAMALVGSVKNGEILGGIEQVQTFELAAKLARVVPCFEVSVPRDLDRIASVADQILSWHR